MTNKVRFSSISSGSARGALMAAASIAASTGSTAMAATAINEHPPASTPAQLVGALHSAFGEHHVRAVHAKGIVVEGHFTPDTRAASLTTAPHLQGKSSRVVVRFSDFTGIPDIPDTAGPANPRGLSIKFLLDDGSSTDIVAHSFNGFPTANPDQFRELLLAIGSSGPSAAKPTPVDTFLASHPIAKTFLSTQKTPASFGSIAYFGVNAFKFTNHEGKAHYVRYQFLPANGEHSLSSKELATRGANYLAEELKDRLRRGPVTFRLVAQIASEGDKIEDPSIAWPDGRRKVALGTIELSRLTTNTDEEDKKLVFIPNNIPVGIETADPMLDFRSKAYPISVKERQ